MRKGFLDAFFAGPGPDEEACVRKGRAPRDPDDLPRQLGIGDGRRRGWNRKRTRLSYAFVRRWLRSRVGRRWDDVWSEVCAFAGSGGFLEDTLRRAVLQEVETSPIRGEGGRFMVACRFRGIVPAHGLVVDPDGILRNIVGERVPARPAPPVERVALAEGHELRLIDGFWYEISFATLPPVTTRRVDRADGTFYVLADDPGAFDLLERRHVCRRDGWRDRVGRGRHERERDTYAAQKRALSSEELRRKGLANDPDSKPPRNRRRRGERH